MMEFADGPSIDPSGPIRVEECGDGLYVLGNGMAFPVADRAEGDSLIRDILSQNVFLNMKVFKSPSVRSRVDALIADFEKNLPADE